MRGDCFNGSVRMNAPLIAATGGLDALRLGNSFADLPAAFYTRLIPTPLPAPYLVGASAPAAALIQLDPAAFNDERFVQLFTGNLTFPESKPLAAVYSGHQFGVWAGQ